MMTSAETKTTETKTRRKAEDAASAIERVGIEPENMTRLQAWLKQATTQRSGIELSIKKLVNWAILQIPDVLESAQLKDLSDRFYDEIKFLETALLQIKQAKARGETLTLQDMLNANRVVQLRTRAKSAKDSPSVVSTADSSMSQLPKASKELASRSENPTDPARFASVSDTLGKR